MLSRIAALVALACTAGAQTYTIRTVAGGGPLAGQPGTSYGVAPHGVAADSAGNVYVASYWSCQVWVINSSGILTQVIGNGACGFSGDGGPAASASLSFPEGVTADNAGNIYIADADNQRVRKVSNGIITTVAGNGTSGYSGDNGPATSAQLNFFLVPTNLAVDVSGNLYIPDYMNNRVRKVSGGIITTVAGTGVAGYNGDNISATSAQLNGPSGVAVDSAGSLYIADNLRVRKVSGGIITTVAGNGNCCTYVDNIQATSAEVSPAGLALDSSGNLYIADRNYEVRKVSAGIISTIAANITSTLTAVAVSGSNVYFAAYENNEVYRVSTTGGALTAVVGNGSNSNGDGGLATNALLSQPQAVAADSSGNLYIADTYDCALRKVAAGTRIISTVAGSGNCSSSNLNHPDGVAVDGNGNLYISQGIETVVKVSGGITTTVAGNSTQGCAGNNVPATSAQFTYPGALALDAAGNLYIADPGCGVVRKLSNGIITTVAGNGSFAYNGDNIPATSAAVDPRGLAVDSAGNLYIADGQNSRIRKVSNGIITTVAGTGVSGYNGDGISPTSAQLRSPFGVAVDSNGSNLYISELGDRIRRVTQGIITTLTGNGTAGFRGDNGRADQAMIDYPTGVTVDNGGNIYIVDNANNRIRELTSDMCSYGLMPSGSASIAAGAGMYSVAVSAPSGCPWTSFNDYFPWETITSGASGSGNGTVTYSVQANPNSGVRTGYLNIAGINFTVTQAGNGCEVGISSCSFSSIGPGQKAICGNSGVGVGFSGLDMGQVSVVMSGQDCQWSVSNPPSWVTILSGSGGTGNGTINYSVASNAASSVARGGSMSINVSTTGTQIPFSIDEAGSTCSYALPQSNQSFSSDGGPGSASVVSPVGCTWMASSNASWVSITGGGSGSADGTVSYTVLPNSSATPRSAILTIASQKYVITQSGTSNALSCTTSVPNAPFVAPEGRTELLGDLILTCSGAGWTSPITADIVLTLNTTITNALTAGTKTSNAMLVNGGTMQDGQVLGYTTVHWPGVTLTPSGGSASIQIQNVRADATLLAVGGNLQASPIMGTLAINAPVPVPVTNPLQTLANATTTLVFQAGQPNPITGGAQTFIPLNYQETSTTSFHIASANAPATRLRMVITGVPSTVQVYASVGPAPVNAAGVSAQGQLNAQLYSADCSGSGGTPLNGVSLAGGMYSPLTVTGGVATATWVVTAADAGSVDTLTFQLLLTNAGVTDLTNIQVVGSLGPVSPAGNACAGMANPDPSLTAVPRYRDFSVPLSLVNLRLTTSVFTTSSAAQPAFAPKLRSGVAPSDVTGNRMVNFMSGLTNESSTQPLTNGTVGGSVTTGTNTIACAATGGGTCSGANGQYACFWASVPPEQTVTCSGSGQQDSSYSGDSPASNTAGVSGDQTPADPSTVGASAAAPPDTGPNVQIESPSASTVSGTITVKGWAVDAASAVSGVQIQVDSVTKANATYGINRQDICNAYSNYFGCVNGANIGFTYSLDTTTLTNGSHMITAVATDSDTTPDSASFSVTVMVNNGGGSGPVPSIVIDQPSIGAVLSGTAAVSGWALDNTSVVGPAISSVLVKIDGNVAGTATYGAARPDVCAAYPGRMGCPNVGYTFALNASTLSPGPHTLTVSASDSNSPPDVGSTSITVSGPVLAPNVVIDAPANNASLSGVVTVSGWAVDNTTAPGTAISSVPVKVDGNVVGNASYGISRPDVCAAYPNRPGCPNVGYSYSLDTTSLSAGSHTLTVSATDSDGTPDTGSASITFTTSGMPPVVDIDSPLANAVVSGTVTVTGWAIDSLSTGTAISQVNVKVDGSVVGNATYGIARPDVCAAYPNRPGCPNVGYSYALNTGMLTSGTHIITLSAMDSDGNPDIGSKSVMVTVMTGTPPKVYIDGPTSGAMVTGVVSVSGWAFDNAPSNASPIGSVQIQVDGTTVGNANYGTPRPDVCSAYPGKPGCPNVGWTYSLDVTGLPAGTHTLTAIATDTDGSPDAGTWSVAIQVSPQTIVSIDSPAAGATVSGIVTVSGWAIDYSSSGTTISSAQLKVDGRLVGPVTYGVPRPDVCAAFGSRPGCPNVGYTYSLNTGGLSAGVHLITVSATDSDTSPDTGSKSVTIMLTAPPPPPVVAMDSPANNAVVSGTVTVSGWAIDNAVSAGTAISSVQIKVDTVVVGFATYGTARPDVCAAYPGRPGCPNVGWTYALDTTRLTTGPHNLTATAIDSDANPDSASISLNIIVGQPTVHIDNPSSGSTVSGTLTISGWAIDNATAVGTSISGVQVSVDGAVVGTATYGTSRPDVCSAYPNRPGCPNVGFTFSYNTTGLSGGNHTITVVATDSDSSPDSSSASVTVVK